MFQSFFPQPKQFFLSGVVVGIIAMIIWYLFGAAIGAAIGLPFPPEDAAPIVGLGFLSTNDYLASYLYFLVIGGLFGLYWTLSNDHPWRKWSVWGTLVIVFSTWFVVQMTVVINYWNRDFYDSIQMALTDNNAAGVTAGDFYSKLWVFLALATIYSFLFAILRFLKSHYAFRWRTAMNDYYVSKWAGIRHIEGASQRIQEDTMRFAGIMQGLGASALDAVMTLLAFLPILYTLSAGIVGLPIIGDIPGSLMWAAIFWAVLGTVTIYFVGIRLPGLEFNNQKVEAAYRKELVYGEDDETRAEAFTLSGLFSNVRKNYFKLYFNYSYFNFFRSFYLNATTVFSLIIFIPTFVAGATTFGVFSQTSQAFRRVEESFQFLFNSWDTIVELLSIRKRLIAFEAAIDGEALPEIDQDYLRAQSE